MSAQTLYEFLALMGRVSIQAGVLVLVVLAVQWLFRRQMAPRWRAALWLLVMARLCLPVSFGSAASLFNWVPHWGGRIVPAVAPVAAPSRTITPTATESGRVASSPVSTVRAESGPLGTVGEADLAASVVREPVDVAAPPAVPVAGPRASPASGVSLSSSSSATSSLSGWVQAVRGWGLAAWGSFVWIAGAAALLLYMLVGTVRLGRRIARMPLVTDPALIGLLEACRAEVGLRRAPILVDGGDTSSPALHGLVRPRLLVPRRCLSGFTAEELRFVFLHELAHVKRHDLFLNWCVALLQIAHWFNPMLWLGFARWRADRELACDALVLEIAGAERQGAYGRTILRLVDGFTAGTATPSMVGILEDTHELRRRISMIAAFRPTARWTWPSLLLVGGLAVAGLTDARSPEPASGQEPHTATQSTNASTRSVVVTVLNAATERPVAGAKVSVPSIDFNRPGAGWSNVVFTTDAEGRAEARVGELPAQIQTLGIAVSHPGLGPRQIMWVSDGGNVRDTLPGTYTVRLQPAVTIGGRVTEPDGRPVAGARVLPWGNNYTGFSVGSGMKASQDYPDLEPDERSAVITDAGGYWRFENCPSDLPRLRVDVVREGGSRNSFTTETGPGGLSVEAATHITLAELLATNAVMRIPSGHSIRGIVLDGAGRPVPGARLLERAGNLSNLSPSITTNRADGTFELLHRSAPQISLTAEAPGFANRTFIINTGSEAPDDVQKLLLAPASPLKVRVVGEDGAPLGGARLRPIDWRSGNQIVEWQGVTDSSGRAVWTNAPSVPVAFWVSSTNYPVRAVKLAGGEPERTVQLRVGSDKAIRVVVRAVDAASKAPVGRFAVWRNVQSGQSFSSWGDVATNGMFQAKLEASEFSLGVVPFLRLQVRAEGYAPWNLNEVYFDEGDQEILAELASARAPAGVVFQPDGKPASGAKVILNNTDSGLFANQAMHFYTRPGVPSLQTDTNGAFRFEFGEAKDRLLVQHETGFASLHVKDLASTNRVQLQAWASVDGVLRLGGKPAGNQQVDLRSPISWEAEDSYLLSYNAQTDSEGRFHFEKLPPGNYTLFRMPLVISGAPTTESHRVCFDLAPGEVKQIDYSFSGRGVVGFAQSAAEVDWRNDAHVLALDLPEPPAPPSYYMYANADAFQEARKKHALSPAVIDYARRSQQFQLVFDREGNFRADDVPPGKYRLKIRVTKSPKGTTPMRMGNEDEVGSVSREVIIPEGKGDVDIGSFELVLAPGAQVTGSSVRAPELPARLMDGAKLQLQDYRGKPLVLVFWAPWSPKSTEAFPSLRSVYKDAGASGTAGFVSVAVDGGSDSLKDALRDLDCPWTQAFLEDATRSRTTEAYAVSTLPTVLVLDRDGRIAGRDLSPDRLRATLARLSPGK